MAIDESKRTGDPFRNAVRTGVFAWIYWLLTAAAMIAAVAAVFGDTHQRIVTGAIAFPVIVALAIARFFVAARIRRQR